ncbi:MAG: hypothetical protein ACRC6M_07620 [Microcystaceae cyanobacterium]
MKRQTISRKHYLVQAFWLGVTILLSFIFLIKISFSTEASPLKKSNALPDLSGLVWLKNDQFLGVLDRKDQKSPRVISINLPESPQGITWQPLEINWQKMGPLPLDLESITSVAKTDLFIVAESSNQPKHLGNLWLMETKNSTLKPVEITNWPKSIENIEAIATAKLGDQHYFFYAERAENKPQTSICWTTLSLQPFQIGDCHAVTFSSPDKTAGIRQISDLAVDDLGNIYISSAFDPNQDNGPFTSSVWKIGQFSLDLSGIASISLFSEPKNIGNFDGFKVEALALRPIATKNPEIFIGTDDENYGGVVRLLPPQSDQVKGP